jgi:hypothetical protein
MDMMIFEVLESVEFAIRLAGSTETGSQPVVSANSEFAS